MRSTNSPALGGTTVVFAWVEESRVQQVLHASDDFQLMLAITLTGFGGCAAALIALAAGALHPMALYLILSALAAVTLLAGGFAWREFVRCRQVRSQLAAGTVRVPVPVLLVMTESPSFTLGGHGPVGSSERGR